MNPLDIQKLLTEPDAAQRQAQFLEMAWFVIGFVILIMIVALTISALRSLLLSKAGVNEKRVWVIVILSLPVIGPCVFYAVRSKVIRKREVR